MSTLAKGALAAATAVLAVAVAGCGTESDVWGTGRSGVSGTVVDKTQTIQPLTFALTVEDADGSKTKLFVTRKPYRRCHVGEAYPACAKARTGGGDDR